MNPIVFTQDSAASGLITQAWLLTWTLQRTQSRAQEISWLRGNQAETEHAEDLETQEFIYNFDIITEYLKRSIRRAYDLKESSEKEFQMPEVTEQARGK